MIYVMQLALYISIYIYMYLCCISSNSTEHTIFINQSKTCLYKKTTER